MKKINTLITTIFLIAIQIAYISAAEISVSEAVKTFAQNKKRMRIAVFDFVNTDEKSKRFDSFIADTIITELSKYKVTLLERKKLALLLTEHELSQSGVVDSEKAMKLGELLPVDVIVSGSYAQLNNRLIINGRFIHVATGEIIHAFTASMDIAQLSQDTDIEKSKCESEQLSVKKALSDLKTEKAINKAVETAIEIPFEGECGKVHYNIMYTFSKYKIFPPKYNSFLIRVLNSIDNPSDDNRTNEIIRFFASDGRVDDDEWKAGLGALKRMSSYALHIPLRYLLAGSAEERTLIKKRADEIIRNASEGKIGKPVPMLQENILFSMFSALKVSNYKTDMEIPFYVFKKYMGRIPNDDKNNKKAAGILSSMYFYANERKVQKDILSLIVSFYKSRQSEILAEECADFFKSIKSKTEDRYQPDKNIIKIYNEDLAIINSELEDIYCASVKTAKSKGYRYIVDERILYILSNKMKCLHAPAIKDLEADMRSGDWDRKLKAAEILSKIGDAAKDAEETVIIYLGQQGFGSKGGKLRNLCAKILGNIRTSNPKAISMLIESFPDYNNGVSYEAEEAINKIGNSAIPHLIKNLSHEHHAVRLRCAKALGNLGKNSKKALPELTRLAEKDDNPYVRKQAQGAIQMINNDF